MYGINFEHTIGPNFIPTFWIWYTIYCLNFEQLVKRIFIVNSGLSCMVATFKSQLNSLLFNFDCYF